jgi:hypothetical protein
MLRRKRPSRIDRRDSSPPFKLTTGSCLDTPWYNVSRQLLAFNRHPDSPTSIQAGRSA